jgi:hypothetical protein
MKRHAIKFVDCSLGTLTITFPILRYFIWSEKEIFAKKSYPSMSSADDFIILRIVRSFNYSEASICEISARI